MAEWVSNARICDAINEYWKERGMTANARVVKRFRVLKATGQKIWYDQIESDVKAWWPA